MSISVPLLNLVSYLNMSAYHLRKTEVIYELKIRNLPSEGTAGDLRKRLSQSLATNTSIEDAVVNSLDTDVELEECEAKYQDLSAFVSDYEGNYNDNEYHRIVARLWHLYLRADRIPVGATADDDHEQTKECLVSKCKELLDSFKDSSAKVDYFDDKTLPADNPQTQPDSGKTTDPLLVPTKVLELPGKIVSLAKERTQEEEGRLSRETQRLDEMQLPELTRQPEDWIHQGEMKLQEERRKQEEKWKQEERRLQEERQQQEDRWQKEEWRLQEDRKKQENHSSVRRVVQDWPRQDDQLCLKDKRDGSRPRYVPVYKWGLKFDNSGASIAAFLERVEELRRARGVTHQELYESAVDLFAGPALVWYRAAANRIRSWHQLTKELREVFQPADYDLRLHQEIFNRVQGDNEPVDLYIAAVEGLYGRLAVTVPESTRLAQIYYNLHPQLQDRLALFSIETLDQLRSMGRRAEAGRLSMMRIRSQRSEAALEPDLAYHDPSRRRGLTHGRVADITTSSQPDRREVSCWNCGEKGHRFRFCHKTRKKFCFGCGKDNILKRDCLNCTPKNG